MRMTPSPGRSSRIVSGHNIFEAGGTGERKGARSIQDVARSTGFENAALGESDYTLTDGVEFLAVVSDIKDGDAIRVIPSAEILKDGASQRRVEPGEGFVEEQEMGLRSQGNEQVRCAVFRRRKVRRACASANAQCGRRWRISVDTRLQHSLRRV